MIEERLNKKLFCIEVIDTLDEPNITWEINIT